MATVRVSLLVVVLVLVGLWAAPGWSAGAYDAAPGVTVSGASGTNARSDMYAGSSERAKTGTSQEKVGFHPIHATGQALHGAAKHVGHAAGWTAKKVGSAACWTGKKVGNATVWTGRHLRNAANWTGRKVSGAFHSVTAASSG